MGSSFLNAYRLFANAKSIFWLPFIREMCVEQRHRHHEMRGQFWRSITILWDTFMNAKKVRCRCTKKCPYAFSGTIYLEKCVSKSKSPFSGPHLWRLKKYVVGALNSANMHCLFIREIYVDAYHRNAKIWHQFVRQIASLRPHLWATKTGISNLHDPTMPKLET